MLNRLQPLQLLALPLLLLGALYAYLPQLPVFASPWEELLPYLNYLLLAPIALLGWHFNSGRSVLAAILLVVTDFSLRQQLSALYIESLLVLLPLNLALIAWYGERGVLSSSGLLRLGLIILQLGLVIGLIQHQPQWLQQWLSYQPEQLPPQLLALPDVAALPLSFVSSCALIIALLALLLRFYRQRQRFDAYLLISTLLGCFLILQPLSVRASTLMISLMLGLWLFGLLRHSHSLAYLDDLTGLPGRRALNEHLNRLGRHYCLAMLDVDHFKKFNDTHGHDVGDQVLKLVASKLARVRLGKAYRYGGEEFCVVFAGRALEETLAPLEELRVAIEQAQLRLRSNDRPKSNKQGRKKRGNSSPKAATVSVTISIGVAANDANSDCLKAADQALYRAKGGGRNRVSQ